MKKFLALIVACMTVVSSFAADKYSSVEFKKAAPVLLRGTFKVNSWIKETSPECKVAKEKDSYDVYLAFCQPCINCKTCEFTGSLKNATLYIVEKTKDSKGKKVAYITATDFALPSGLPVEFSTGQVAALAKKGDAVIELKNLSQQKFGILGTSALIGTWNQKSWFTGLDQDNSNGRYAVIMGVIQKLDATITAVNTSDKRWANGTLALRRDDGFTKTLMLAMTTPSSGSKSDNPFLNCGTPQVPITTCFSVLTTNGTPTAPTASFTKMETMVENYIFKKSGLKSYEAANVFLAGVRNVTP